MTESFASLSPRTLYLRGRGYAARGIEKILDILRMAEDDDIIASDRDEPGADVVIWLANSLPSAWLVLTMASDGTMCAVLPPVTPDLSRAAVPVTLPDDSVELLVPPQAFLRVENALAVVEQVLWPSEDRHDLWVDPGIVLVPVGTIAEED